MYILFFFYTNFIKWAKQTCKNPSKDLMAMNIITLNRAAKGLNNVKIDEANIAKTITRLAPKR